MNFSVSSSRTSASTHARKYSDPKQPSRENIQRKKQTETKSCVELRVQFRWRRPTSKISCCWWWGPSSLPLKSANTIDGAHPPVSTKERNVTKTIQLHKNRPHYVRVDVDVGGRGHARCCVGVEKDFFVMMIRDEMAAEIGSLLSAASWDSTFCSLSNQCYLIEGHAPLLLLVLFFYFRYCVVVKHFCA